MFLPLSKIIKEVENKTSKKVESIAGLTRAAGGGGRKRILYR
jgi:hypothetical protein